MTDALSKLVDAVRALLIRLDGNSTLATVRALRDSVSAALLAFEASAALNQLSDEAQRLGFYDEASRGEVVAFWCRECEGLGYETAKCGDPSCIWRDRERTPLYAAPPATVPLAEYVKLRNAVESLHSNGDFAVINAAITRDNAALAKADEIIGGRRR